MHKHWEERRTKAQYPSWPDPVYALRCDHCPFTIRLLKSGRAVLNKARKQMREHIKTHGQRAA